MQRKKDVFELLRDTLKKQIELGVYKKGEKLPSVRTYSVENKFNPGTVHKAYMALEAEGYLNIVSKKGAFVCYGNNEEKGADPIEQQFIDWRRDNVPMSKIIDALVKVYGRNDND